MITYMCHSLSLTNNDSTYYFNVWKAIKVWLCVMVRSLLRCFWSCSVNASFLMLVE